MQHTGYTCSSLRAAVQFDSISMHRHTQPLGTPLMQSHERSKPYHIVGGLLDRCTHTMWNMILERHCQPACVYEGFVALCAHCMHICQRTVETVPRETTISTQRVNATTQAICQILTPPKLCYNVLSKALNYRSKE